MPSVRADGILCADLRRPRIEIALSWPRCPRTTVVDSQVTLEGPCRRTLITRVRGR